MPSVTAIARQMVRNGTMDFAVLVPELDLNSAFTSMHPRNKGVNVDVYRRILKQHADNNTGVLLTNYVTESSLMGSVKLALQTLIDNDVKPLATTIVPPPTSMWRFHTTPSLVINITSGETVPASSQGDAFLEGSSQSAALAAILHVDDMSRVWTASTTQLPNATATGKSTEYTLIGDTSAAVVVATAIQDARRVAGLVIITSDDAAVTPTELLTNMLMYELMYVAGHSDEDTSSIHSMLPDIFLLQSATTQKDFEMVTLNATFTTSNGTVLEATREVLVGAMGKDLSAAINMDVDEVAVAASAKRLWTSTAIPTALIRSISIHQFDPAAIANSTKDSLFYEDQAYLLNLSRVATAYDPVVGSTLQRMPEVQQGPVNFTCYAGECAQASLVARALQWRFDADLSFIDSGGVRGAGWANGDVHLSYLFAMFPFVDNPCYGTFLGLHILQVFEYAMSVTAFQPRSTPLGVDLIQAAGVRIEYAMQGTPDGIGAKIVSFKVYNKTTAQYEPLKRLHYYTFASNDFMCALHATYSSMFSASSAYRGETTDPYASTETLTSITADYLTANNPYTPLYMNYYIEVPLLATGGGERSYLTFPTGLATCRPTEWYDVGVASCIECPNGQKRSETDSSKCQIVEDTKILTPLVVGLVVGGAALVVLVIVIALFCEYRRRLGARSNINAPDGKHDVAVIFTDIKSSTRLWGAAPMSMGVTLDAHHQIIREAISNFKGYEVKTVGDCFMIVVDKPQRALDLAVSIQNKLHNHKWPSVIGRVYRCLDDIDFEDDPDEVQGPQDGDPWNGLRVRIGVHYGPVEVILDEITKGYDYYGPTVNVAARVEGVTDGGQICITATMAAAVHKDHNDYKLVYDGPVTLRGVKEETFLFTVVPTGSLEARTFDKYARPERADSNLPHLPTIEGDGGDSNSSASTGLVRYAPLNATTRPVRNAIKGALKALHGKQRVAVIEKLRKAWRIQLPSGKAYTGITEPSPRRFLSQPRGVVIHRPSVAGYEHSDVDSIRITTSPPPPNKNKDVGTSPSMTSIGGDEVAEREEDLIFRVVAQRVAPFVQREVDDDNIREIQTRPLSVVSMFSNHGQSRTRSIVPPE